MIGADDNNYQATDNVIYTGDKIPYMVESQYIHEAFTKITDFGTNPSLMYNQAYSTAPQGV